MDERMPDGADDELWEIVDGVVGESVQWAERLARLGLLREDQVEDAAALRSAALSMEKVKRSRWWRRLPRHRRRDPEHAMVAVMRKREG